MIKFRSFHNHEVDTTTINILKVVKCVDNGSERFSDIFPVAHLALAELYEKRKGEIISE
jgi:hypothetical protein